MSPEKHAIRDLERQIIREDVTNEMRVAIQRVMFSVSCVLLNPDEPELSLCRKYFAQDFKNLELLVGNAAWLTSTRALLKEPT